MSISTNRSTAGSSTAPRRRPVSGPTSWCSFPAQKQLVVDAKVPLTAYLAAQELGASAGGQQHAQSLAGQQAHLLAHAKALKAHVDALSSKKYWDIPGNSPELVVCFLPAESILAAALSADPALLDYALSRNVVLASPSTLLAVLKSVAFTWRQDVLTDSARELFELAHQLYERMGTLGENVTKLGASLKTSVDRYNSMVGTLEARVLPTARKLNALDAAGLTTPAAVEVTPRSVAAPELQPGNGPELGLRRPADGRSRRTIRRRGPGVRRLGNVPGYGRLGGLGGRVPRPPRARVTSPACFRVARSSFGSEKSRSSSAVTTSSTEP